MATISQRLAFLISANADQAIKAFDKTANAAEKQMGKATKSIDNVGASMTKFGAAGLAAAGVIGSQLFKAGQSASNLSETMNKSQVVFSKGAKEIEAFGKQAADSLGLSQEAAVNAATTFAIFGKSAGLAGGDLTTFSKDLVTLSADFASFFNTSPEDSILAIGAALRGESEPIRRYGILLNDAVLKQEAQTLGIFDGVGALNAQQKVLAAQAAILKQSSDAQGDFARTSDGLANTQRRLAANLENTKAAIGEAVLPVLNSLTTGLNAGVNGFNSLNGATGNAAGKLATYGTVALGAISTLSLLGGQAIKARDRFTTLGDDGTRSINNLGKAAVGVGIAFAAFAATDIVFNAINDVTNASGKATDSLKALNIALSKTSTEDAVKAFRDLVKKESEVLRFGNIISDFGKQVVIAGGEAGRTIEDIDRSFKKLLQDSGPQAAQALIDALKAQTSELDANGNQYKDNTMLVERFQKKLDLTIGSTNALTEITNESTKAGQASAEQYKALSGVLTKLALDARAAEVKRVAAEQEKFAEATKKAEAANEAFKVKVMAAAGALKDKLNTALEAAEENAKKAKGEFDAYAKSISDAVMGTISLGNAQATANTNTEKVADAQTKVNETLKALNLARASGDTEKIAEATQAWSDATKDLAIAQKAPQTFMDVLKGQASDAKKFGENLLSLKGLGLSQAAFDQIAGAGAEAGNQIASGILLGADPAGKVAEINKLIEGTQVVADLVGAGAAATYKQNGVDLANALLAGVTETVAKFKLQLTFKNLKNLKKPIKSVADLAAAFGSDISGQFTLAGVDAPAMAQGGIVSARTGGTMVRVGEGGRSEAIVPLPAQGLGGSITINVNAGMGADGTKIGQMIVDELQAYQRRVGSLPLKVSA